MTLQKTQVNIIETASHSLSTGGGEGGREGGGGGGGGGR